MYKIHSAKTMNEESFIEIADFKSKITNFNSKENENVAKFTKIDHRIYFN